MLVHISGIFEDWTGLDPYGLNTERMRRKRKEHMQIIWRHTSRPFEELGSLGLKTLSPSLLLWPWLGLGSISFAAWVSFDFA